MARTTESERGMVWSFGGRVRTGVVSALVLGTVLIVRCGGQEPITQIKTGVVQQVDPVTSTIAVMVTRELTFFIGAATEIEQHGAPLTITDIHVGDTVTVTYSFDQARNRIASKVVLAVATTATAPAQAAAQTGPTQTKTGVVQRVDAVDGTVDVMVLRPLTFTINAATRITGNGQPATLADVQVGATVTVTYYFDPDRNRIANDLTWGATTPAAQQSNAPAKPGQDTGYNFTLDTTDAAGKAIQQKRVYWVYRPAGLDRGLTAPIVVILGGGQAMLHRKADEAGFIAVGCSFSGNSTGTPGSNWRNDDPRVCGWEDYDYISTVIERVRATENGGDAFTVGLSKNGHMSLAYACERPDMLRAAASVDEFMGLTTNHPTAPLPILMFQGTADTNVPYTKVKDTADAWRAMNGLMDAIPVTTFEPSPRRPGFVTQATWTGGVKGTQVAVITIVGGTHTYPQPNTQTGYDFVDGLWAFCSQFLTTQPAAPRIVAEPTDNVQPSGQPASFHVVAAGAGQLRYQWQRNGQDLPGETNPWLTLRTVTAADQGATFRAVVRSAAGATTSRAARLTVAPPPAGPRLGTQPQSVTVAAGQPAGFTVTAAGGGNAKYQWRCNGIDLPGATAASYTLAVATPFDSGALYTVQVTDHTGTTSSAPATLAVTRPSGVPIIVTNPERNRLIVGQTGSFAVNAWSATPLRYQWQQGPGLGHMADISGATAATYTTPTATAALHGTLVRCLVSNASGAVASASDMILVTPAPRAPNEFIHELRAAAQVGTPFAYDLACSGGTRPLTWQATQLPAGLTLDPATGQITGEPAKAGDSSVPVTITNPAGALPGTLYLTVTTDPPVLSPATWRRHHFGASAEDLAVAGDAADPDRDGITNLEEYQAGSNPLG